VTYTKYRYLGLQRETYFVKSVVFPWYWDSRASHNDTLRKSRRDPLVSLDENKTFASFAYISRRTAIRISRRVMFGAVSSLESLDSSGFLAECVCEMMVKVGLFPDQRLKDTSCWTYTDFNVCAFHMGF